MERRDYGRRVSSRAVLPLIYLAVLLAIILAVQSLANRIDPTEAQRRQWEITQAQAREARLWWVNDAVTVAWGFIPPALVLGLGIVGLIVLYNRLARWPAVQADKVIAAIRADRQAFPAALQTLNYHHAPRITGVEPAQPEGSHVAELQAGTIPCFADLLLNRQVGLDRSGRRQPLILGYDTATTEPVTGDWRSLYSTGLGGLQGSGKTWGSAFLLAQSALAGAKLVICDPHAGDEEGLAARVAALAPAFLADIADDELSILAALKLADSVLQRRKQGDKDRTPLIVAIDEWASLRRGKLADVLPYFVEDFSTEGRKLNCHVMLLSQRWDKERLGDFRNTLASSYVYRMRADEARMMTGMRAATLPRDTLQLQPGQAYLLDTRGSMTKVSIPLMSTRDMEDAGRLLLGSGERAEPFGNPKELEPLRSHNGAGSIPSASAEAVHAAKLFLEGKDPSEIVMELRGVPSKGSGSRYQKALGEVLGLIREGIRAA